MAVVVRKDSTKKLTTGLFVLYKLRTDKVAEKFKKSMSNVPLKGGARGM